MKKRMNALIAILVASILTGTIPATAQQPAATVVGTWEAIKALPSRDELTINLRDGSTKKGRLADVTDTAVMLSQGKSLTELRRDAIFQIYRTVPKSRSGATAAGAAVGGGLGLISGLMGDGSSGHGQSAGIAIAGVFVMAGVGALIGRGISRGHERVLIYETRR